MPRPPKFAARTELVHGSVFEKFRGRLASAGERYVKLHIGDRHGPLPYDIPIESEWLERHPHVLQYCNTFGIRSVREAMLNKLREDNGLEVSSDELMVTAGASNGLSVSCQALFEEGDEVLVLTPAWPFFFGMVRLAGATVRELPLYARLYDEPDLDLEELLESVISEHTAAIYVNSPNNPSGKVLTRAQLESLARVGSRHDLWMISDEAYDGMTFDGAEHISLTSLPDMRERTLTVFSCSKSFAFAGVRLGFLLAPPAAIQACNKLMVHQFYGPNTPGQQWMAEAIVHRAEWLPQMRSGYQRVRDEFLQALELDVPSPEGTYFVFFDATAFLRGRSFDELVGACLDAAVSVAPGGDFGSDFGSYLRLCFTADAEDRVMEGARRLRSILTAG